MSYSMNRLDSEHVGLDLPENPGGRAQITIDLTAVDREGRPCLMVEVKTRRGIPEDLEQLRFYHKTAREANRVFPFAMLVDMERIQIFKWDGSDLMGPIQTLDTKLALGEYSDYYTKPMVIWSYLVTLVEVWLRDLGYHWKFPKPPFSDEIAEIGLLSQLEGADTFMEIEVENRGNFVY